MWTSGKRRVVQGAVLLLALFSFTATATAQERAPSEAELHSIYCVEVLRAEITTQNHMISATSEVAGEASPASREQLISTSSELLQRLAQLEGALRRLQVYMLPRIPGLDARALAAAIRQANADAQGSWSDETVLNRVRACENPSWAVL
jgi:hypothetical protein